MVNRIIDFQRYCGRAYTRKYTFDASGIAGMNDVRADTDRRAFYLEAGRAVELWATAEGGLMLVKCAADVYAFRSRYPGQRVETVLIVTDGDVVAEINPRRKG